MAYNVTAQLNLQLNPQSINQIAQALNSITNGRSIGGNLFNTNQIRDVTNELNNTKNAMMQFGEQAGLAAKRFGAFTLVAGSLVQITQGFRSMISEAVAFDREMVKLKQVSNETAGSGVAAIRQEIDRLSTGLGVSSSQLARVSVILKQANLNLGETKTALEALALSALAPNFDSMEKTAEGAIAVLKQFKIPVEELKSSLGSINAVAGEFAVEASDLIGVIQRTGGAFKAAGGNLNELLALFTSVRQTTRESAESISTGLRTIFTRIQRTGTADALREVGVNLRYTRDEALALGNVNLTSQFVGAYEAVRRLSIALNQIPSTSPKFAQLVEELGGYRQISKVIPLIQEFSISQNALNVAITGGSSLMNSAAAAQGSFGNRLDKLKESYLQFGRALLDSSSFKTLFTMFETGAKSALMLLEALKPLLPMLTVFATMKIAQGIGSFGAGFVKGVAPVKKSSGGLLHFKKGGIVPGSGHGDIVPAMLEPGEMVIPKRMVKKYSFGGPHTADIDEEALNNPSAFRSYMKGSTTINPKTGKYRKFFHGTKGQDFDYFSNAHARNTWFGRGHYFSADAKVASRYSETDTTAGGYDPGARVMSTTLQMKNPYTWNSDKSLKDFMTKGGKKIKSINGQFDQKDWNEIVKKGVLPEDISQGTLDHLNKIFTKFPSIAKKWNQAYSEKIDKDGNKIIKGMSPESKMKFVAHGATQTLKKQGYDSVNVDYGLGKDYFNASTVFSPNQIKGLGNEGGWDPSLKEIGKNLGGLIQKFAIGGDVDESKINNPEGFRAFMKGSKTLNAETGKYKKFFHGTRGDNFNTFNNSKTGGNFYGKAHYFAQDYDSASSYSGQDTVRNIGSRVLPTTLQMKNPYSWDEDKSINDLVTAGEALKARNGKLDRRTWNERIEMGAFPEDISEDTLNHANKIFARFPSIAQAFNKMDTAQQRKFFSHVASKALQKQGFDSINIGTDYSAVFKSNQIKSLYNTGTWDSKNTDIMKNLGGYIDRQRFKFGSPGGVKSYYGSKKQEGIQDISDYEFNLKSNKNRSETLKNIIGDNIIKVKANIKSRFFKPVDQEEQEKFKSFQGEDKPSADEFEIFVAKQINGKRTADNPTFPVDIIANNTPWEVKNTKSIVGRQEIFDKYIRYKLELEKNNQSQAFKQQLQQNSGKQKKIIDLGDVGIAYNGQKILGTNSNIPMVTQKKASGGFIVPGVGDTDSVPMDLPVGSYVIKKSSTKKMGFANGGVVPAILTPGELVIDPKTASGIGRAKLDHMNRTGRSAFAKGGRVGFAWGGGTGTGSSGNPINDLLSFSAFDQMDSGMRLAAENLAKLALRTGLASDVQESYNVAIKQLKDVTDKVIKEREQLAFLESMGAQGTAAYTQQKLKLAQAEQQANNILNRANQARVQDQPDQLATIRSKKELQDAGISPTSQDSIDMAVTSTVIARKRGEIEKEYMESVMLQIKAAHPNLQADEQLALAKKMYEEALVKGTMAVNSQTGAIEGDTRYKAKGFDAANLLQQEQNANKPKKESLLRRGISAVKDQWNNNPEMKSMVMGAGLSYLGEGFDRLAGDAKTANESGTTSSYISSKGAAGSLQGASMGMQMGSVLGPYGMLGGAVLGGAAGYLSSSNTAEKELKDAKASESQSKLEEKLNSIIKNPKEKVDMALISAAINENAQNAKSSAGHMTISDSLGFGRSKLDIQQDVFQASREAKQKTAGQTSSIVTSQLSKQMTSSTTGKETDAQLYALGTAAVEASSDFESLVEASRQVGESFAKARERIVKDAASMARAEAAKKAGLELEKTIGRSNTFLKTFADNLEGASVRVQKSFSQFDSIMASLDSGSRQMQSYELEKNAKVFSNPTAYSSSEFKSTIESTFSNYSPDLTQGLANQYGPMADIGNKLPQILADSVNDANPIEAVERKLSEMVGGKDDPNVKAIINSLTAKLGGKDSLKDISGDTSKLAEELMKPIMDPMANYGAKINQLNLENINKLSAGFAKLNIATLKLVDGIEKSDNLRLDQMQTMASAQSIASGQSLTGELGPNPQLQLNVAALQQSRVLGMAGRPDLLGNTAGIGEALREAQDRQREIEKNPVGSPLEQTKAFSNAGAQVDLFRKALQDSIPKMQQVAGEYTKQANEMQKQRMAGASLAKKLALGGRETRQEYKSGEKVFNKLISGQITQEQVMKSPRLAKQLESFQQMHQGVDYRGMNVEDTINKMVYSGAAERRGFGPTAKQEAAVRMQAAQAQGMAADAQDQLNLSAAKAITAGEQALVSSQDSLRLEIEKLNLQMQLAQDKTKEPSAEIKADMKGKRELLDSVANNKLTKEEEQIKQDKGLEIASFRQTREQEKKYSDAQTKSEESLQEALDAGPKENARMQALLNSKKTVEDYGKGTTTDAVKKRQQLAQATGLEENDVHAILTQAQMGIGNNGKPTSFSKALEIRQGTESDKLDSLKGRLGTSGLTVVNKEDAVAKAKAEIEAKGGSEKVEKEVSTFEKAESERKARIKEKEDRIKAIEDINKPPQELMGPPAPPNGKQIAAVKVSAADTQPVAIAQNPAASGVAAPTKPSASEKLENLESALSSNATLPPQSMTPEEGRVVVGAFNQALNASAAQNELMGPTDLMGPHEAPNNQNLQNKLIDIGPPLPSVITEPYDAETTSSNVTTNTPTKMETWKKSGGDPRYKPLPQSMISGGDPRFKRLPQSMTSGGDPRFRRVPQFFMPGKNQWKGPGADTTGIMGPLAPPSINQNSAIMGPPAPPSIGQNNVMSNNGAAPQNNQSNTNLNQSTSFNQTAASFTGFTASFDNSIANFNSAIENFGVKVGEFAAAVSVIPSSLTVNGEIGASVTTNAAGIVTQISEAVNAMIARQVIKSLPTPSMDEASKPS
jgi:TP901 family phage tail tape measure protein